MRARFVTSMLLCAALCNIYVALAQAPITKQQSAIVSTWNAIGESYSRENLVIDELTKSMRLNPPWRVVDAREPAKRDELINKIIEEHKRRIKLFEKLKAKEVQSNGKDAEAGSQREDRQVCLTCLR